jgi:hypothetical protein
MRPSPQWDRPRGGPPPARAGSPAPRPPPAAIQPRGGGVISRRLTILHFIGDFRTEYDRVRLVWLSNRPAVANLRRLQHPQQLAQRLRVPALVRVQPAMGRKLSEHNFTVQLNCLTLFPRFLPYSVGVFLQGQYWISIWVCISIWDQYNEMDMHIHLCISIWAV